MQIACPLPPVPTTHIIYEVYGNITLWRKTFTHYNTVDDEGTPMYSWQYYYGNKKWVTDNGVSFRGNFINIGRN